MSQAKVPATVAAAMNLDAEPPAAKRLCTPGKSAGAGRSRPVEGTIAAFREKHGISREQWEEGHLSRKQIAELPSLLQFPHGLTELDLCDNQIVDVSGLNLPEGLTGLDLSHNQIVDVSGLTLPEGLTSLNLTHNQIVDVSGLTLPEGLTMLILNNNQISANKRLQPRDGLEVSY